MIRKLEHNDMKVGYEIEVKPKSNLFLPGKIFVVDSSICEHCGVGYAWHFKLRNKETGGVFKLGWPLSSIRNHFHKIKPAP